MRESTCWRTFGIAYTAGGNRFNSWRRDTPRADGFHESEYHLTPPGRAPAPADRGNPSLEAELRKLRCVSHRV